MPSDEDRACSTFDPPWCKRPELLARIAKLEGRNAILEDQNAELWRDNDRAHRQIRELGAKVERLREIIKIVALEMQRESNPGDALYFRAAALFDAARGDDDGE